MRNLYLDFDGVILNTIELTYKIARQEGYEITGEALRPFYEKLNWHKVLNEATPINDSFNKIKKLNASNKFNISILTHVTSLREATEKINFLSEKLKDITIITVPKDVPKTRLVKVKDSILVDDFNGNLDEWKKNGGIPIRFDLDMEPKGYTVIDSLDKILDLNLTNC